MGKTEELDELVSKARSLEKAIQRASVADSMTVKQLRNELREVRDRIRRVEKR